MVLKAHDSLELWALPATQFTWHIDSKRLCGSSLTMMTWLLGQLFTLENLDRKPSLPGLVSRRNLEEEGEAVVELLLLPSGLW